jgi:hypothetical protein
MVGRTSDWKEELGRFLKPFLDRLGHKARHSSPPRRSWPIGELDSCTDPPAMKWARHPNLRKRPGRASRSPVGHRLYAEPAGSSTGSPPQPSHELLGIDDARAPLGKSEDGRPQPRPRLQVESGLTQSPARLI